jgi:hypothetical protein
MEIGHAYCKYILNRIPTKFILHFYEFSTICHEILNFESISEI